MIYLVLLFISLITHWMWLANLSILTSGDWVYQDPQTLKEFFSIPSIWTATALGDISIGISFSPFLFLYGLLAHLHVGYGLSERLLFLWPIIFILPISSYLLVKKNINNTFAAAIGSIVYSYNTYFGLMKTGHLTLLAAYTFIPLVILFFQKTLETKKIRYSIITGLLAFIVSFYEFRAFYLLCFFLFFYVIFYLFLVEKIKNLKQFLVNTSLAGLPLLIAFLLNAYWLLALGKTGTLSNNVFFERGLFGNEFLNILQAFTLHHPFWTGSTTAIFEVQSIPFYFWIIPLIAFLGLYLNRKNKLVLFYGAIALLGIFLTKQVGLPFTDAYLWLYNHFPGFNAFREASKFYLFIILGYSILIAAFIDTLLQVKIKAQWQSYGKYALLIIIAGCFLWNTKPLITGEMKTIFTPRSVPQDYLVVNNFLLKQPDYSRTYWIPTFSRWSVYTQQHPQVSAVTELNGTWLEFIGKEKKTDKYKESELITLLMNKPYMNNLLDLSSVKYVFIPLQDTANDDDFFQYYGKDREYYIKQLDKLSYLKRTNIGTQDIVVYENNNFQQHFYQTDKKLELKTNYTTSTLQKVQYENINPAEYRIHLKNIKKPVYLHFSERYHPQWQVRINNFNWFDALVKKNYFIADKNHFQNEAKLNSFFIDPTTLCKEFSCIQNKDKSYDIEMTVYFKPQSYVYLGLIISSLTLGAIIIIFLIFLVRKYVYEKK